MKIFLFRETERSSPVPDIIRSLNLMNSDKKVEILTTVDTHKIELVSSCSNILGLNYIMTDTLNCITSFAEYKCLKPITIYVIQLKEQDLPSDKVSFLIDATKDYDLLDHIVFPIQRHPCVTIKDIFGGYLLDMIDKAVGLYHDIYTSDVSKEEAKFFLTLTRTNNLASSACLFVPLTSNRINCLSHPFTQLDSEFQVIHHLPWKFEVNLAKFLPLTKSRVEAIRWINFSIKRRNNFFKDYVHANLFMGSFNSSMDLHIDRPHSKLTRLWIVNSKQYSMLEGSSTISSQHNIIRNKIKKLDDTIKKDDNNDILLNLN